MRAERRYRRAFGGAAAVLLLALGVTACGGSGSEPIRIGYFSDCKGGLSTFYERAVAGAGLPFVRRGAKPLGSKPSDGVGSVSIGGKRVELLLGCHFRGSLVSTFAEARRLIEEEGADILVTPVDFPDDSAWERRQPVALLSTGLNRTTTLVEPVANLFRFNPDTTQGMAGLGSYAYNDLGWRTAAVFGQDDFFGWEIAAGFVAEFCSLGGKVVGRYWAPQDVVDWSPLVRQIPPGVDGVALMAFLQGTASFFSAYKKLQPDLPRHVVMSAYPISIGQRPVGVVAAGFLPFVSNAPKWVSYLRDFRTAFPAYRNQAGFALDIYSFNAVEAALEALEQVNGDLSGGERRFMAALGKLHLRTPAGTIRLDANRHAIGPNFLIRVERDRDGRLVPRTMRVIPDVEQTFNGQFSATSPWSSRTQPVCRKGNPPSWAR